MKDKSIPAFPCEIHDYDSVGKLKLRASFMGMSLRDYFAGQALVGFTSDINYQPNDYFNSIALDCYEIADAMLKERDK